MLRRNFLAAGAAACAPPPESLGVVIEQDPGDLVAAAPPVRWARGVLEAALRKARASFNAGGFRIYLRGKGAPQAAEALAFVPGREGLEVCGHDARGLVYALLELADRVESSDEWRSALTMRGPFEEQPANRIRSILRCFVSDVEDKPWFNDRAAWRDYLDMAARERFNRVGLAFGIGYDFPRQIRDCYFHFPYPFLLQPRGFNVRTTGVSDAERDANLEMLRFISDETAARGLQFSLQLWTHAFQWTASPEAKYIVQGLEPEKHAEYCHAALGELLRACPNITALTFRVHGESGVAEGSYAFWRTIFDAVASAGRRIELDLHAKGIDDRMIDTALATRLPVTVSPKFWAEHMGLPYHQAAIRELEMPPKGRADEGFFALSSGSRRFLRYGYGDLLATGRRHGVLHRIWPGTQRLLLWGDPVFAAGYGRAFSFCGSDGVEIMEPLAFKGRKGGGQPGGRCAYLDRSLEPRRDWEKYRYTYRLWGRMLYNPNTQPAVWQRLLQSEAPYAAAGIERALAPASRILPLITTAHGASGANATYWPEMYTDMPITAPVNVIYGDTPAPRTFVNATPFDPALFARVRECAAMLLDNTPGGKVTPLEVAAWLDGFAGESAEARRMLDSRASVPAAARRVAEDAAILCGIGGFFAGKMRAAVLYAIFERTKYRRALEQAVAQYQQAIAVWRAMAQRAQSVYAADISFGYDRHLRGHWLDRIPAMQTDLDAMRRRLGELKEAQPNEQAERAVKLALARPARPRLQISHTPPRDYVPGAPIPVAVTAPQASRVLLHCRPVNQGVEYTAIEMQPESGVFRAAIPEELTRTPFPVLYYFEVFTPTAARLWPGFDDTLANQPYYVLRSA